MLSLRPFTVNGEVFTWASPTGVSVRAMFLIMWRTGMRKDDAIRLRGSSVWARTDGGFNLRPGSSKTDPLGQRWGPDVISLPAPGADPLDASSGLHALAPAGPTAPLFRNTDGHALSHSFVDAVFHASAVAALGAGPAKGLSTHSFRIGVATRLAAAGFSNDYIRRFGRWATVGMVDVYARQLQGSFADGHAALCCPQPVSGSTPAPDPGPNPRAGPPTSQGPATAALRTASLPGDL
jgi:integrase